MLCSFWLILILASGVSDGDISNMSHDLNVIKSAKGLKLLFLNARSLLQHFDELENDLLDGVFDVIVFGETWLHSRVGDHLITSNQYNLT